MAAVPVTKIARPQWLSLARVMRAITSNAGAQSKRQFRAGTSAVVSGTLDAAPKAFDGDIYAYLGHGSGISNLLNRAGRTASDAFGYSDNGSSSHSAR